jgi:Leucine-rich repeat (LRR) protein
MIEDGRISPDVVWLDLKGGFLSDLSPLANLPNLQWLRVDGNNFRQLGDLGGAAELRYVNVFDNPITLGQVEQLRAALPGVSIVHNAQRELIDDARLAELVESGAIPADVVMLDLSNNEISDLTPLMSLTHLQSLNLNSNFVSDLTPLSVLTALGATTGMGLHLESNLISDLSGLEPLTALQVLTLNNNQIEDVSPLGGLLRLWWLGLSHNEISDIVPLAALIHVRQFEEQFEGNPVTSQEFSELRQIQDNSARAILSMNHLHGRARYRVSDALEILRYLVRLPNVISECGIAFRAAMLVSGERPGVRDALQILRSLVRLPSALNERGMRVV